MPINSDDLPLTMQKMVFIYNAILQGWTVRKIDKDKFEFTKGVVNKREVNLEDYLRKFIEYNISIENISI